MNLWSLLIVVAVATFIIAVAVTETWPLLAGVMIGHTYATHVRRTTA
jgi:hypothetical protein